MSDLFTDRRDDFCRAVAEYRRTRILARRLYRWSLPASAIVLVAGICVGSVVDWPAMKAAGLAASVLVMLGMCVWSVRLTSAGGRWHAKAISAIDEASATGDHDDAVWMLRVLDVAMDEANR